MNIDNKEFMELCEIVLKRNELCRRRTRWRNKRYRLQSILKNMQHNVQIDKARRAAEVTYVKKNCKLRESVTEFVQQLDGWNRTPVLNAVAEQIRKNTQRQEVAANQLSTLDAKKKISKNFSNMKISDVKLLIAEARKEIANVEYETALFTKQFRKRQAELVKKMKVKLRHNPYYNRIDYITFPGGKTFNLADLQGFKNDADFEREILRVNHG